MFFNNFGVSSNQVFEGFIMERKKDLDYAKWLAQYYLSYKMLTRHEIYEKLVRKEVPKAFIAEALDWLEEQGYIDDFDYAVRFIRDSVTLKKRGKMRIMQELRFKRVSQEVIDRAFDEAEVDFGEALEVALEKRARGLDLGDRKDRDRLIRHLVGKGFGIGDVIRGISEYCERG